MTKAVFANRKPISQHTKNKLTLKTKHSPVPKKLNALPPLFLSSQSVDKKAPQT